METENICEGYIIGFCPFEEFNSGDITLKCSRIHDSHLKNQFSEKHSNIDRILLENAQKMLQTIVNDTDKKIQKHLEMIQPELDEKIQRAIEKTEEIIESKNVDGFTDVLPLLRIHGQLCDLAEKGEGSSLYSVCTNCSAFKETDECVHGFCQNYLKAREILDTLKDKLNK